MTASIVFLLLLFHQKNLLQDKPDKQEKAD